MPKLTATTLTQLAVDQAPAKAVRYEKRDAYLPGLVLVIQPLPSRKKSWAYRYRDATGAYKKHTLGPADQFNLEAARDAARKVKDTLKTGAALIPFSAAVKAGRASALSQSEADKKRFVPVIWDRYVAEHLEMPTVKRSSAVTPKTMAKVKRIAKRHFLALWEERRIDSITKTEALELIGKVKTESGPFAANNLIGVLSSFFRWSLSQAIITSSPLEAVQKSKEVKGVRSLSDAELKSIWLSCDQIHPVFRDAIRMLTLSGCRRDEVATMEWSHVDFGNKRWTIPEVKNRKPHTVHLTPAMLDILEKRPRIGVSRYVFTTTGDSPISGFSKVKKIIDCEVKIPEWRFHDFRRTITDGLIKLGVAFEVRERVLSHTLKGVAASYTTHTFEKEMAAAWTLWSDHVTATVAVRKSNLVPIRA